LVLLGATIGSGIWLTRSGRPYSGAVFNTHKLVAVAAVVFSYTVVRGLVRQSGMRAGVLALAVIAGLLAVALFATGGLLGAGKAAGGVVLMVHRVAPALVAVATGAVSYLLVRT
jgi:hypothetical protein